MKPDARDLVDALAPEVVEIATAIKEAGGRALLVGGLVRDHLLRMPSKDIDVEVYGLSLDQLETVLSRFGNVVTIGKSFGVLQVKGLAIDFALPRRDSKVAPGHRGFNITVDPTLSFEEAARRRDLTINSMGVDPLTGELLDPHGGSRDLERGVLRATDPRYFSDDPLRGLRVAQFAARFEAQPDAALLRLCSELDLGELPAERLFEEMRKLLLKGVRPSIGFEVLRDTGLLGFFPELAALVGLPQDPGWHPEGDVWVHTLMVVDAAAVLRDGRADDEALMFAALCHDLGKQSTTQEDRGRIRSLGHDVAGVGLTERFLGRLRAPNELTMRVCVLVEHHLAPTLLVKGNASAKAYRRLARKLGEAGVDMTLMERVARADHLGRANEEAAAGLYPPGDVFLDEARELRIEQAAPQDVVMGRHLIARGLTPGLHFRALLDRCREVQDETGWDDPDRVLAAVLGD